MEAQTKLLPPPLKSLAEKLYQKRPMDCKDAINELSSEERIMILDPLVEFVKGGRTLNNDNNQVLLNCIRFFLKEEVFELLQRVKTGELLRQFCSFFDEFPDFYCLIRMSKILLTNTEKDFLRQILMILNENRYMGVPIGIQTLRFLEKEITSPLSREITVELREKILNFLLPMKEKTVRVILGIRPTDPFDVDVWIMKTRKIIENYKARQPRSE
jgi:hypothetical protein